MPGAAPQGTKSGNFFFTISIDGIEKEGREEEDPPTKGHGDGHGGVDEVVGVIQSTNAQEDHRDHDPDTSLNVSRVDRRINKKSKTVLDDTIPDPMLRLSQEDHERVLGFPQGWKGGDVWTQKYVDDVTIGGKNLIEHATSHISTHKEKRLIHAGDLEPKLQTIQTNSKKAGMIINPTKTQMLCVSQSINYTTDSYVKIDGETIESGETIKILGFTLDRSCLLYTSDAADE